eukprot:6788029-Alexandrium_andersonii.AAC.1
MSIDFLQFLSRGATAARRGSVLRLLMYLRRLAEMGLPSPVRTSRNARTNQISRASGLPEGRTEAISN